MICGKLSADGRACIRDNMHMDERGHEYDEPPVDPRDLDSVRLSSLSPPATWPGAPPTDQWDSREAVHFTAHRHVERSRVAELIEEVESLTQQRNRYEDENGGLKRQILKLDSRIAVLEKALKPLANIADVYDDDGLDQCRPEWNSRSVNGKRADEDDSDVELYSGRGGRELLYLRDALEARVALRGDQPIKKKQPSPYSTSPSGAKETK